MKTKVGDKVRLTYDGSHLLGRAVLGKNHWTVFRVQKNGRIIVENKGAAYLVDSWVRVRK